MPDAVDLDLDHEQLVSGRARVLLGVEVRARFFTAQLGPVLNRGRIPTVSGARFDVGEPFGVPELIPRPDGVR